MLHESQSNVSSEDWARRYHYDEILWPNIPQSEATQSINTVAAIAKAAAHDAILGKNFTLFAVGGRLCGKTGLIFGNEVSKCVSLSASDLVQGTAGNNGLLPQILEKFVNQTNNKPHPKCSVSIVEVVDEDVFRDILGFSHHELNENDGHSLKLRHVDQRGAILDNLHRIPILNVGNVEGVINAFENQHLKQIWMKEGGHGHFVVSIVVEGGGTIQLVDCASADRPYAFSAKSADTLRRRKHDRRMSGIRKSLSSLRGVLRDVNDSSSTNNASATVSFRECTLTQLLQRGLNSKDTEQQPRVCVIGVVSPSIKNYNQTLSTLDFTTRLVAQQGNATTDPFHKLCAMETKSYDRALIENSPLASVLPSEEDFLKKSPFHSLPHRTPSSSRPSTTSSRSASRTPSDRAILKSIVSDPRQRLAKLLSTASSVKNTRGRATNDYNSETPNSVASEDLQTEFQKKYDTVLDQLDTLMSADEEDIDKRNYGNSLIVALSEKKASPRNTGYLHDDLSAKELFSPEIDPWTLEMSKTENGISLFQSEQHNSEDVISSAAPQRLPSEVVFDDVFFQDTIALGSKTEYNTSTDLAMRNIEPSKLREDDVPVASEKEIKNLQSQFDQFLTDNNSADCNLSSNENDDTQRVVLKSATSDEAPSNTVDQIIQALQSEQDHVMRECENTTRKQEIFVKSSIQKRPLLNTIPSTDSMDSELLVSCRSHATQVYGSLHASHNVFPFTDNKNMNEECNENYEYKENNNAMMKSDPSDLNDMMATFEKEIDTFIQLKEVAGHTKDRIRDEGIDENQYEPGRGLNNTSASNNYDIEPFDTFTDTDTKIKEARKSTQNAQGAKDHIEAANNAEFKNEAISQTLTLQKDLQRVTSRYNEMCAQKDIIANELNETLQLISSRDTEILNLKNSIQSSEQKLKSFSIKSAEVMKERIGELQAQHTTKIASLNNTIAIQSLRIKELEKEINSDNRNSVLETELYRIRAENVHMEQRLKQMEKSSSLKVRNANEQLLLAQNDLFESNEETSKHKSENKSLKDELAHLRDVMSIAEESVDELQRLRQENEHLQKALNSQRDNGALSGKRFNESINFDDDQFVHERISALMRESEHSNISMRTLQKENAALKDSIDECHNEMSAMRKEMIDLRLLSTARKFSPLSEESNATHATSSLKTPLEYRRTHKPDYYFPVTSSTLQTEDTSFSENHLVAQLSAEKELRYKAEDICAGVLANTQAGYDKRDAEIRKLREKLFKLSNTKY